MAREFEDFSRVRHTLPSSPAIVPTIPRYSAAALAIVIAACAGDKGNSSTASGATAPAAFTDTTATSPAVAAAAQAIDTASLLQHIKDLAADSMEGRAPGTPGEEKAVAYLSQQFQKLGLKPGNPDGSYIQKVDLIGYKAHPTASFTTRGKTVSLRYPDDYIANSRHNRDSTRIEGSEVVFVGYGVVAPEYGWDDYKGVDVKGKTILMLINDPAVPAPNAAPGDTTALDTAMFKGKAMTYYGRWTYKYEIASQKGAAAAIIIHETGPAGYPYSVVRTSWAKENFELDQPDKNVGAVQVRSWITEDVARKLLSAAGQDFDSLKKTALTKSFRPVTLKAQASIDIKQQLRSFKSHNVIGKLEGSDPKLKDEYVIYSAHWDHLGKHTDLQGDQIFNGAVDNA